MWSGLNRETCSWLKRNLTKNARFIRTCPAMPGISWGYTKDIQDNLLALHSMVLYTIYEWMTGRYSSRTPTNWFCAGLPRYTVIVKAYPWTARETLNSSSAACYMPHVHQPARQRRPERVVPSLYVETSTICAIDNPTIPGVTRHFLFPLHTY